jgi:predicted secreted hydrolase
VTPRPTEAGRVAAAPAERAASAGRSRRGGKLRASTRRSVVAAASVASAAWLAALPAAPAHGAGLDAPPAHSAGVPRGSAQGARLDAAPAHDALVPAGVSLPADEAPHHDPIEWWYFNGHLQGRDAAGQLRSYGFEYVTFQFIGLGKPVYLGDLAVTDLTTKSFHYGVNEASYPVPAEHDAFSLHTGSWTMSGGSGKDILAAGLPGYDLHLQLRENEPAVLHGHDGVVNLGPLGTSYYYSWASLLTSGTIDDHGAKIAVTGLSWMDHEWGEIDFTSGAGWDWFSVQLTDGEQFMLDFLRDSAGKVVQTLGTQSDAAGSVALRQGSFSERATGSWKSPHTGYSYDSGWQLGLPGGHLTVTPDLLDQELDVAKIQGSSYWEGDCTISGVIDGKAVSGVGYTELDPPGQL